MSTRAIELLEIVDLLDKDGNPQDLSRFDDPELIRILEYYCQKSVEGVQAQIETEAVPRAQFAALRSSFSSTNTVSALLPSAFVYSRVVVDDPLMHCVARPSKIARADMLHLGMNANDSLDRDCIRAAVGYVAALAPLIRDRAVVLMPVNHLHRPPDELPIFYSADQFESDVPQPVRAFIRQKVHISEVFPLPGGRLAISPAPPSTPTRGIAIDFQDDVLHGNFPMYLLFQAEKAGETKDGKIPIRQWLDWDNKPSQAQFDIWVRQSLNKTVLNRFAHIASEMALAQALNASYVTESPFESELIGMAVGKPPDDAGRTRAVNFLTANAPFLKLDSPDAVAAIRRYHARQFERWQETLVAVTGELSGEEAFEEKARRLFVKEIEPQVREMNAILGKMRFLAGAGALGAVGSILSVGLALLKATGIPLAAQLAILGTAPVVASLAATLPSVGEFIQKRKGPVFIWSKITK